MLAEIRADLSAQQLAADQLHDQQEAECTNEINEYDRRINVANGIRQAAEDEIATLKQEISQLEGDIRNKKQQLDILNQREIDLRDSRARDADNFAKRQSQSVEVVGALDLIIEKFSTIKGTEAAKTALADLAKIGTTNPIMALVEVASTFSQDSLDKVKGKLEELRVNLQQSIEDDKTNEQAAIGEYDALMQELDQVRKAVSTALSEAETKLKQQQSALAL
jgi:chromosome segregation ATPase